jgi:hypothetical protein
MKAVAGVLVMLATAAPASAAAPPPSYERFEAAYPSALFTATGVAPPCGAPVIGGSAQNHFLVTLCQPTLTLTFPRPQASVELFAKTIDGPATLVATGHTGTGDVVDTIAADVGFKPIVLTAPGATITSVDIKAPGRDIGIDDVAISPVAQPDTEIAGAPAAVTPATTAEFTFTSNVPVKGYRCSLDAGPIGPCGVLSGLGIRGHTLAAAAVDAYDAVDLTPATAAWNVVAPPPDTSATVEGASAVFSGAPSYECSLDGGAWAACTSPFRPGGPPHKLSLRAVGPDGQVDESPVVLDLPADADHDDIPDDLERLPLANRGPQVGEATVAQSDSGTVYVKLPGSKDFVRFAGAASLPVGSVVDTLKGQVTIQVASNGYAKSDRRHREASVTLSSGIFEIRQARMRKGVTRVVQIPIELVLKTPANADRQCRTGSLKGVVRRLTATGKGAFRVTGAASRADARNASFTTTDRCDGTLTRVTKGRAKVARRKGGRAIAIHAGHRYFAKARLFIAKKGRQAA